MSLKFEGLPERFFSLFGKMSQKDIALELFPGDEYKKKQSQISNWKHGREPIPRPILNKIAEAKGVRLNWLLTGEGEKSSDLTDSEQSESETLDRGESYWKTRAEVLAEELEKAHAKIDRLNREVGRLTGILEKRDSTSVESVLGS